jgi:hypothetical protein
MRAATVAGLHKQHALLRLAQYVTELIKITDLFKDTFWMQEVRQVSSGSDLII